MSRFTKPPISQPAGGETFSGAALAEHINEAVAAMVTGHFDTDAPAGAGKGMFRSRPNGDLVELVLNDGDGEEVLFVFDPSTGKLTSPRNTNPFGVTAEQVGAFTKDAVRALLKSKPNRNLIINGAMEVAQRGLSAAISTSGFSYPSCDRFCARAEAASSFAGTLSQVADAPVGFSKSLKWVTTAAEGAVPAGALYEVAQRIKGEQLQHIAYGDTSAENMTLSFWVKSSVTGAFSLTCFQSGNSRLFAASYTVNAVDTWEKKTINIPPDVAGLINNDTSDGFRVTWGIAAGNTYQGTATSGSWEAYANGKWLSQQATNDIVTTVNASWQLTGVQLEIGDVASEYDHAPYEEELERCEPFFETLLSDLNGYGPIWSTDALASNNQWASWKFKKKKRVVPAFGFFSGGIFAKNGTYVNTHLGRGHINFAGDSWFYMSGVAAHAPIAYADAEIY